MCARINTCAFMAVLLVQYMVSGNDQSKFEGQPCIHTMKNLSGTCTLLINCKSTLDDIENQILPQICGLGETAPYVCCPKFPIGYKSRTKCVEYSKMGSKKCNIQFDRHENLVDAVSKEFPHVAIFGYSLSESFGRDYFCGGVLISERFVLTDAHCATTTQFGEFKYVLLGDLNLDTTRDNAEPQEFKIEKIIPHPKYKEDYNGIALIKLNRDVEFTPYVKPVCLNTINEADHTRRYMYAGYGRYSIDGDFSKRIRRIQLQLIHSKKCKEEYSSNDVFSAIDDRTKIVCAGSKITTCYSQSGGSLIAQRSDVECMYDLIGMWSFAKNCGIGNNTEVFNRVSYYLEWIENIVWP